MSKKQRRTVGSIVTVPIDNYCIHAQTLPETDMVFFDTKELEDLSAKSIVSSNVIFRVACNNDAILDGRWVKVGKAPLSEEHANPVPKFIQDALNPTKFEIYLGGQIRPATKDECINLDRCAVWAINHIEDRIRDHYNNVPNVWVDQMRLK